MPRNQSLPPRDDVFKDQKRLFQLSAPPPLSPLPGTGTVGSKDTLVPYPEAGDERTPTRLSLITFLQGKGSQTQVLSRPHLRPRSFSSFLPTSSELLD